MKRVRAWLWKVTDHKAIAGLVVIGVVSLCSAICAAWGNIWSLITRAISGVWFAFTYPVFVPVWLLVPLVVFSIWFVGGVLRRRFSRRRKPSYLDYREDAFQGVVWRWSYHPSGRIYTSDIAAFCPLDGTRLAVVNYSGVLHVVCETCKKRLALDVPLHDYSWFGLQQAIARQIERKTNSGEWKVVVENQNKAT